MRGRPGGGRRQPGTTAALSLDSVDNGACRLSSGRFLVVDTIPLEPPVKAWLDGVTQGGELIEAVLATHPFHTLYFPPFHKIYPKVAGWVVPDDNDVRDLHGGCRECPAVGGWLVVRWLQAAYYGTPRHLSIQPDLPWAGPITDVLDKW